MSAIIMTDSCCDLPISFINEHQIPIISLGFFLDGKEYVDDFGITLDYHSFYDMIRSGKMSTTSQINTQQFIDFFRIYLDQQIDILFVAFSSALSGTCNSALIASNTLKEEYPDRTITVIDSLCASMGQGLLVHSAVMMKEEGYSLPDIVEWLENNKLKLNHWFTVEDLNHLKKGGRISAASAFVGTILDIKPILNVNNEGKLSPVEKVKGRKKSLRILMDKLEARIINAEQQTIMISHGDSLADAKHLKELILSKIKVQNIIINNVGPVIGSHSGPGTIALFFYGEQR